MSSTRTPSPSHSLSAHQHRLLGLVFKFRFVTIPLLQDYLHLKHQSTIRRTLQLLQQNGYLTSIYDSSYKIDRKPALYLLSPKGLRYLKADPTIEPTVLHAYYKNRHLSEAFKQHQLTVLQVCNALRQVPQQQNLAIFTKAELAGYTDFPTPPPDLYLRSEAGTSEYFVELIHDQLSFVVRKRLKALIDHSEEEGWTHEQYPTLLFICQSTRQQARCKADALSLREGAGISPEELPMAVTTLQALMDPDRNGVVWIPIESRHPVQLE